MKATEKKQHLLSVTLDDFAAYCAENDLPAYRAKQVLEWVYSRGGTDFEAMTNLSKSLRKTLLHDWDIFTSTEVNRQKSKDGTVKLLLEWPDKATSECVLISEGKRRTVCVSSQVGCPVKCRFCASGITGLQRQLSAGEIVEQAMRVKHLCEAAEQAEGAESNYALSNIVFMGLGEPLANYDAVLKAIRIINANWGMNLGARKITLSTVGLPKQIRRLAKEELQINLAISLHAPTDALRRELIPWARKVSIDELVSAGRYFFDTTGREITVEYVLLGGLNDSLELANKLVSLSRKMRCNVNLIRYNPVPSLPFERPSSFAAHKFAERLRERGVNTHIRKSKGTDIAAACGQLRRAGVKKNSVAKR